MGKKQVSARAAKTVKIANDPWAILIPQMAGGQLREPA